MGWVFPLACKRFTLQAARSQRIAALLDVSSSRVSSVNRTPMAPTRPWCPLSMATTRLFGATATDMAELRALG